MKGIIRTKHIIIAVAIIAVLAVIVGMMQIKDVPNENAISGVVFGSELDQWKDSGYALAVGESMEVLAADFADQSQIDNNVKPGGAVHLTAGDSLTFEVKANKAGLYRIQAEYAVAEASTMNCMLDLKQDGDYPYDDAQHIVLPQLLTVGGYPFDRNKQGDEIAPIVYNQQIWQVRSFRTMSQSTTDYLLFYLDKGVNELTIHINEGNIYLSRFLIDAPEETPTYAEYVKQYPAGEGGDGRIVLEAERMTYKNSTVPRPSATRDITAYPFESSTHLMNTVGGDTWNTNGAAIYYEFEVTQPGWYRFGMKTQRSAKSTAATNTYIYRSISIDGQLPFQEADTMIFPSSREWEINWLGDGEQEFRLYLTEGTHVLGLEVNSTMLIPVANRIRELNDQVNDISLEIRKIIGNNTDVYRDWELENYIPGLGDTLYAIADELDVLADRMTEINRGQGMNTSITSMRICGKQLRVLAEDPDEIPNHMTLLTEGSGSVSQKLGELSEGILNQPLSVDQIYLMQDGAELPESGVSSWAKLVEEAAYFLSSFGNNAVEEEEKVITVWVNRARNYVDLLQSMIDSDFTVKTGIRVKLSVMPSEQKLILSNTNGTQPDAAMGVSCAMPYQMALRGALADLRQFDGFNEVARLFAPGSHVMHVYGDGIYALTDTQDYYVMYYRSDLLEKMGIPVPETWEEVLEILPELRRHGMNFYTPLSGNSSFKSFYTTMPFIYQKGATLYAEDGHSVALNSQEGLEAMRFMTDLYTIYGLPNQVGDFYQQFRSGTMPIGIASFPIFLKLDSAAAELSGKWKIALVPGFESEDGEITHWSTGGGQTSMIFEKSENKEEAWEFLKWWYSTEVQVEYGQQIQMLYGDEYLWNTANLEAFAQLPIDEESKAVILEQMEWLYETPQAPASYMVEREISNVWNKIVLDGENARSALDDAVIIMNQEHARKLEEFGYIVNGVKVKDYRIATVEMIEEWIGVDDK